MTDHLNRQMPHKDVPKWNITVNLHDYWAFHSNKTICPTDRLNLLSHLDEDWNKPKLSHTNSPINQNCHTMTLHSCNPQIRAHQLLIYSKVLTTIFLRCTSSIMTLFTIITQQLSSCAIYLPTRLHLTKTHGKWFPVVNDCIDGSNSQRNSQSLVPLPGIVFLDFFIFFFFCSIEYFSLINLWTYDYG